MLYTARLVLLLGQTAEEIAISIVAEIKSVLSSTRPESLHNKEDTIHLRSDLTIENSK